MTYQEANQKGRVLLEEKHMEDASVDAWLLLEFVTGMNRTRFFVENYKEMPEAEEKQYFALIKRRRERIPLQHLTGTQEFMGLDFRVNEHVLIPRQDTELLVLEAEKRLGILKTKQAQVLDMCTGSGCIAISLKKRSRYFRGSASDSEGKCTGSGYRDYVYSNRYVCRYRRSV